MNQPTQHELAGTVGADAERPALLAEIIAKVGEPEAGASDDDLDLGWGGVEIDRLASGLTLAVIARLSEAEGADGPAGPWLRKSDASGDGPTELTPQGREAVRRLAAAPPNPES
ncbi:MAG: hypothetical protein ABW173_00525 [Sphingomonas sp.]